MSFGDSISLLSAWGAKANDQTPPGSPQRNPLEDRSATPDRSNDGTLLKGGGEAARIVNADSTPNRNLRFSSAYRKVVRKTASASRVVARAAGAEGGATPAALPPAVATPAAAPHGEGAAGVHSASAPSIVNMSAALREAAAAAKEAAAAIKAHDDFTRAYSNNVLTGKKNGDTLGGRSGSFNSETEEGLSDGWKQGVEPSTRQDGQRQQPTYAADETGAAASFSLNRSGAGGAGGSFPDSSIFSVGSRDVPTVKRDESLLSVSGMSQSASFAPDSGGGLRLGDRGGRGRGRRDSFGSGIFSNGSFGSGRSSPGKPPGGAVQSGGVRTLRQVCVHVC